MMKNIIDLIKEKIRNHKKLSIIALLLFLLIGGTVGYVLLTNNETNNNPKVTQTNNQNKNPDTNVTGSKEDKKDETKKTDNKKQEDKKEEVTSETNTEETITSTSNNTSTVENNNVSNNTANTTNNISSTSNTVSKPTSTPCVPTYTTVNHPEQGHYETHVVQEAWDDPQFDTAIVGLTSGHIYSSVDDFIENSDLYGDGNYASKTIQVGTVHHDTVTTQVWVVDQAAWTETVTSGC